MAVKTLNIEVGDQLVKVCRLKHKGKDLRMVDAFMFQTPSNCVSDGVIEDVQTLAIQLREELEKHGLSGVHTVNFALSSGKVAIREAKLPVAKEKQLAAIVKTNAEEYFPVDLKNYHVTHSLLGTVGGDEPHSRVLVMAAPLKMLEGYFKLANMCGFAVGSIDTSGNAHYQALRGINGKGVTVYVDVDCTACFVTFMQGDTLLLQRTFAFGGDELIAHHMAMTGKSGGDYLSALNELDVRKPELSDRLHLHTEDVQSDLNRLIGSIARSIDYYNSSNWNNPAEKIVLMGPCRHLTGFCELLADTAGLEVIYLDNVPEFTFITGGAEDASSFISCIGCSLKPLDLMPNQFLTKARAQNKNESIVPGVIICIGLVVISLAVSAIPILDYVSTKKELADVEQKIESLQHAEDSYNTFVAYQQGQAALQTVSDEADKPNSKLVGFFNELEAKMPTSILLLNGNCTNESVSLNVTVGSYADSAVVLRELRSFDSLESVEISSVTRSINEAGIERVAFSINCAYGENPYLNNINPYEELIMPEDETAEDESSAAE